MTEGLDTSSPPLLLFVQTCVKATGHQYSTKSSLSVALTDHVRVRVRVVNIVCVMSCCLLPHSASFNSWDRQSWFWEDDHGVAHSKPEPQLIRRNLILNKDYQYGSANSDWAIDQ